VVEELAGENAWFAAESDEHDALCVAVRTMCWWLLITALTTSISVNQVGINIFLRIIFFRLTNSRSFGGMRCFVGLCTEYARNNTKWSIYKDGETWT
jgi:hypothetical protein